MRKEPIEQPQKAASIPHVQFLPRTLHAVTSGQEAIAQWESLLCEFRSL
jgi:hypothetical protein